MKVGAMVKSNREFVGVPMGTKGMVVEDYGTGIMVAWDLPQRPLPSNMSPEQIAALWAVDSKCPLRDGFDKETELQFLEQETDSENR